MTPEKYTKGVLKTEPSPEDYEKIKDRFSSEDFIGEVHCLINLLMAIKSMTEDVDVLKKRLFYGSSKESVLEKVNAATKRMGFQTGYDPHSIRENIRLIHGLIGAVGETGELTDVLLDALKGYEVDRVNLEEELGDLAWYEAIAMDSIGTSHGQVWQMNYDKLSARYGERFSESAANDRNLQKEREVLENQ